jgi:histidinol-phosphate aminotransferase
MKFEDLLRANIRNLTPYSSARDEYKGKDAIFLDANENPYNSGYNRYPDPQQWEVKKRIAQIKGIQPEQIFLGNGSDEGIDLLIRALCEPHTDNIVVLDPSYGMYQVCADTHAVEVRKVLLTPDFKLDMPAIFAAIDSHTKIVFLCSPNNPTANCLDAGDMQKILKEFNGLVVIDEAYIDFCPEQSTVHWIEQFPNLVVLQTLSKAWGLAAIRLGMAFAQANIIRVLSKIKMPYNINILTQQFALEALKEEDKKAAAVREILEERKKMEAALAQISCITEVFPSDANFILVRTVNANGIYQYLSESSKVIVRNRHKTTLCQNCLRITVGTPEENSALLQALRAYKQ